MLILSATLCVYVYIFFTAFYAVGDVRPGFLFNVRAGQEVILLLSHAFLLVRVSCPASKAYILLP